MAEKIVFSFRKPPKELEVRKIRTDRIHDACGSAYGKIRWRVEKIHVPAISVRVGDILTTSRVYEIARTVDKKAAHQFDLHHPKDITDAQEKE